MKSRKAHGLIAALAALALAGCATTAAAPPKVASPPPGQQWLFGSAEGAVAVSQAYQAMAKFVVVAAQSGQRFSAVLQEGSTPSRPSFVECGKKPFAAVFDADETLIWNLGAMRYFAEKGMDFDPKVWDSWEKTGAGHAVAMPGAVDALNMMRKAGVTIIVNTNRSAANASGTEKTLREAGLGEFTHGKDLFLMGDTPDGSSKDGRRALIAKDYCVLAMAGDQLGDFSQAFNDKSLSVADRKAMATNPNIVFKWGQGWFMMPNPVYGPSIRGSYDEVFPPSSQWQPEGQK